MTPPVSDLEGNDIEGFSHAFMESEVCYELLFYQGLAPASAETDSRFGGLTQAEIFSISSEIIFGYRVTRNGGNREN